MKNLCLHIFFLLLALNAATARGAKAAPQDEVEIGGEWFSVVRVGNDDSLFGVSQAHGWDYDVLLQYNPDTSPQMKKGMKVYYPLKKEAPAAAETKQHASLPGTVTHTVKKGENIYNIAMTYGVTPDDIYAASPATRSGIFPGMEILIPSKEQWAYETVDYETDLYQLAKEHRSRVADILKANPALKENNFRKGTTVRVPVGSDTLDIKPTEVQTRRLDSFRLVKTTKEDSWAGLARQFDTDVETLIGINPDMPKMSKNAYVGIPVFKDVTVTRMEVVEDPREQTPQGREEIYTEVHEIVDDGLASVAIVVENPSSKKDKDFLRGFFQYVDGMKRSGKKVNIKVIDDSRNPILENLALIDSADMVITTFEKDFPVTLAEYAQDRNIEVINAYDVKSEAYQSLPNVIQLMTPSDYFNDAVSQYVADNFTDYFLLSVGKPDEPDPISTSVMHSLSRTSLDLTPEEFAEYIFTPGDKYFVYSYQTSKQDVADICDKIAKSIEEDPEVEVVLFGRPNWVLFADGMKDKLGAAHVQFPSRMFFNEASIAANTFNDEFMRLYEQKPVRMYPNPAVMGYDVASFFLPTLIDNKGDFNVGFKSMDTLQTPMDLQRLNNWGGIFNPSSYILKYGADGSVQKKIIQ